MNEQTKTQKKSNAMNKNFKFYKVKFDDFLMNPVRLIGIFSEFHFGDNTKIQNWVF